MGQPVTDQSAAKGSKRKGTRSVSTLTPSQLARKRANDREAQRAIRARTKEHIERLESELEELKSHQSRDKTVQDLLRRNKALEEELNRLRESLGLSLNSSPFSNSTTYDETGSSGSGAIPSPRMSPLASNADYTSMPDYSQQQYVGLPQSNSCESWASNVPNHINSNVSSPASSAEEYVTGYIPTSVPTTMMPSSSGIDAVEAASFRLSNMPMQGMPPMYMQQQQQQQPAHHQQDPQWQMYNNMYYGAKDQSACLSR